MSSDVADAKRGLRTPQRCSEQPQWAPVATAKTRRGRRLAAGAIWRRPLQATPPAAQAVATILSCDCCCRCWGLVWSCEGDRTAGKRVQAPPESPGVWPAGRLLCCRSAPLGRRLPFLSLRGPTQPPRTSWQTQCSMLFLGNPRRTHVVHDASTSQEAPSLLESRTLWLCTARVWRPSSQHAWLFA